MYLNNGFSIIVCCFNSAKRLPETLRFLFQQDVPSSIPWEIIIVDNCSTDNTADVALSEFDKSDYSKSYFKVVNESKPGLSFARQKGVDSARFDNLIFCDDDNWLAKDYITTASKLFETWPNASILGGCGLAYPETAPPAWFNEYSSYYATGTQHPNNGLINGLGNYVYGAGLVIKKAVILELNKIDYHFLTSDRQKEKLSSGADVELCYAAELLGFKIAYSDQLRFFHFIPKERLDTNYLKRLVYQLGYCDILHRPYYWLFNTSLPRYKKKWQWVLLISAHIAALSLIKYVFNHQSLEAQVNLEHSKGRLVAILKMNSKIERTFVNLKKMFKT